MQEKPIEERILQIGKEIFEASRSHFLKKQFWNNKLIELSSQNPYVKTQLFRFVDVYSVLKTFEQKKHHLLEYLNPPHSAPWPRSLKLLQHALHVPGLDRLIVSMAEFHIKQMARRFIGGHSAEELLPFILQRRPKKIGFTIDLLGETVFSEQEAQNYRKRYLELIQTLGLQSKQWQKSDPIDSSPLGDVPPVNVSVKVSSLDHEMDCMAWEKTLERLFQIMKPLIHAAMQSQIFLHLDMEQYAIKDLINYLFKKIIFDPPFKRYRHFGIVVQAYLKSSLEDVKMWIRCAKERGTPFTIRLVKGAYWDYEMLIAAQNGWEPPVFHTKADSDANFERCASLLLDAYPQIELAIGSHNIRSIAHALAYAEQKNISPQALEFQMLYGMADPFKEALVQRGLRVREYVPVGDMLPGLSYLVRRLLENTSNDSFLKQSFMDKKDMLRLLQKPKVEETLSYGTYAFSK